MKFSQICIKRPVLTIAMAMVWVILGVLAFTQLDTRFMPLYYRPVLNVEVDYPGASSQVIEKSVTTPLENALAQTPSLSYMASFSDNNVVDITLHFLPMTQSNFAIVQAQVMQELGSVAMPTGVTPQVWDQNVNNFNGVVAVQSSSMSRFELSSYVYNTLQKMLAGVPGVASVAVFADQPVVKITLRPERLNALKLSVNQVFNALNSNNNPFPLGSVSNNSYSMALNVDNSLQNQSQIENVIIANIDGRVVHLKDVADVSVGSASLQTYLNTINGLPALALGIFTADAANPISTGASVLKLITQLNNKFHGAIRFYNVVNLASPLNIAINDVYIAIAIAIGLVILVTQLFLGSWRATLIPIVTIPVCLIAAFAVMFALGFSINMMTLLSLVLAVGLVVDDAIVVLENTHRHIEDGLNPLAAAQRSIDEIAFAIFGITIALVAVYVPIVFLPHTMAGIYYAEFSFTLAGAVLISGFLALSLSPMMCARLLHKPNQNSYESRLDQFTRKIQCRYQGYLNWVLDKKQWIITVFGIGIIFGTIVFRLLPSDLLPPTKMNLILVNAAAPPGASSNYTFAEMHKLEQKISSMPRTDLALASLQGSQGHFWVSLAPKRWGDPSNDMIANQINQLFDQFPGLDGGGTVFDYNRINSSSNGSQSSLRFYLAGNLEFGGLNSLASGFAKDLIGHAGIVYADGGNSFYVPQYNFVINKNLAATLGVDLGDLTQTLSTYFAGTQLTNQYNLNGQGYNVMLQLPAEDLKDLKILSQLYVKNDKGQMISLARLVTVTPQFALAELDHINQQHATSIGVTLSSGVSAGAAMDYIEATAARTLPNSVSVVWDGFARDLQDNNKNSLMIFGLGVLFIYLVLAALFESFIDPFIILLTVPLCIVGALLALLLVGGTLNMYTNIGLITLIGLVAKHGVLITQFANQQRAEGRESRQAIIEAAGIRLRPILMTSLTMILGALPLVFGTGVDAIGKMEIGVVIMFGLLIGSFFSLFVVPVAYELFSKVKHRFKY